MTTGTGTVTIVFGNGMVCSTQEQRTKLYKALSLVYHPDVGGSTELMQALNDVRDKFK